MYKVVKDAIEHRINSLDEATCEVDGEGSFFVCDLGSTYRALMRWKKFLPSVVPFYAVKCNPDPLIIRLLASLNSGFDCASKGEMEQVLAMGVSPSRIIYANPAKSPSHLRYSQAANVKNMTFDNEDELYKIHKYHPHAQLFIRILIDDSKSLCQLSLKFGAPLYRTGNLLSVAKKLGLDVVGVSFHIGSSSYDPNAFIDAIGRARQVFDQAAEFGYQMHTLDIGGGFSHKTFELVAPTINTALDQHFGSLENVKFIAEPGRYLVSEAFSLATNIIARRSAWPDDSSMPATAADSYMYYLNDGIYGSFNCILFDHVIPKPHILSVSGEFLYAEATSGDNSYKKSSIWGPTCDSLDCVLSDVYLPVMNVGDWLLWEDFGAYTLAASSHFNGFDKIHLIYVCSEDEASRALISSNKGSDWKREKSVDPKVGIARRFGSDVIDVMLGRRRMGEVIVGH